MEKKFNWTPEEEEHLINNYANLGALSCANFLNKTKGSVYAKAHRMNLVGANTNKLSAHIQYENKLLELEVDIYPVEKYINSQTSIKHICLKEHITNKTPNSVLNGSGCLICNKITKTKTAETYAKESPFKVLESYVNNATPILHKCNYNHKWRARPYSILKGSGCPICSKRGFKNDKPAILYYLKIEKENLCYYKIGITNNSIEYRFKRDYIDKKIQILYTADFELGEEAYIEEQKLLKKHKLYRVTIKDFLKSGGNTELFEIDVLGLDT